MQLSELPTSARSDPRDRLLSAAGPVFASRGFERATLREISSAAEVNVAAVAYYFGDKMGLYREVIQRVRESRERRFPAPNNTDQDDPRVALARLVRIMLSRMLNCDEPGWETQLLMREMDRPTAVFADLVNEFFRPLFNQLVATMRRLTGGAELDQEIPQHLLQQLALSTVGQCLYYRVGRGVVDILIPQPSRDEYFDIDSLSRHITAVMIAATRNVLVLQEKAELDLLLAQADRNNPSFTANESSQTNSSDIQVKSESK